MKYYKKIDIDFYDEIVQDTLNYLKNQRPDIYNKSSQANYYLINVKDLKKYCPKLDLGFARYNIVCNFAAAFVIHFTHNARVHVDDYPFGAARINIPIINTKNTFTRFYTGGEFTKFVNAETTLHSSILSGFDTLKFVEQVEIDQATVVRVNEPHNVIKLNREIPRITLTLGFDKDPVFLLED